jgi:hypothetical protein
MLITFTSKAAADIIMYQEHIAPILSLLGKDIQRGVITSEETASVIQKIEEFLASNSLAKEKQNEKDNNTVHENDLDDYEKKILRDTVSLSTRLFPFLEMLRAADKKQVAILWGV